MLETTVFKEVEKLQQEISKLRSSGLKIGLVPTMGALHQGHISLVKKAKEKCDVVVVSIFVNPTQFNNNEDLEKYPRTEKEDVALLNANGVNLVFVPNVEEIYPADYQRKPIDLGSMAEVMEGKFRPGHFDGMVEVVARLFNIVQPDCAFFGQKDFQQLAIIRFMVEYFQFDIEIIGCPIVREESGLAMSSRNMRLSKEEQAEASKIFAILSWIKDNLEGFTLPQMALAAEKMFDLTDMKLEYLSFVNTTSLQELSNWDEQVTCCVAAYCGDVRLIDNIELIG